MTNKKINIAIAEACGWRKGDLRPSWCHPDNWSMAKNGSYEVWVSQDKLPNYCNDLNAMHEAEQMLWQVDWSHRYVFNNNLANILKHRAVNRNEWDAETLLDATAGQRAEAFLRTLGKWEETK